MLKANPLSTDLKSDLAEGNKRIGLFAKYWQPGKVKTRLAKSIGTQLASELYRCFVKCLVTRLSQVPYEPILAYSPANEATLDAFNQIIPDSRWALVPQSAGNLGNRIQFFFQSQFDSGAKAVALIGSDSPNLPLEYLEAAMEALQTQELVLGPSADGGYYLIGMSGRVAPILDDIPWSTSQVWETTMAHVRELNVEHAILPTWYDVDEFDDLQRLFSDLRGLESPDSATKHLISELQRVLGNDSIQSL